MPKLTNLDVERVSLVDRAAVRDPSNPAAAQRFLLWKREGGAPKSTGGQMPDQATPEELSAALEKAEAERDELTAKVEKLEKKLEKRSNKDSEKEKIDKSALPKEVRAALEKAEADAESTRQRAEEAEKVAKAERDQRIEREFVTKAQGYRALPIDANAFGPVLKRASESLSEDDYKSFEDLFKAADEQIAKGKLFEEIGKSGQPETTGDDAGADLVRKADELRKADPSLSEWAAMEQARHSDREAQARLLTSVR